MPAQHHPAHTHLNPLPRERRPRTGALQGEKFGALVGTVDHITLNPHDGPRADDNHVYLWLKLGSGPAAGRYECSINTHTAMGGAKVQFFLHEEEITFGDFPSTGFWAAALSYSALGLKQKDFKEIENGSLRSLIYHYAERCNEMTVYGISYSNGDGLHHVHMNAGEARGSGHPNLQNEDGALAFYFRRETAAPRRAWIFIKFATQKL
jgi:hypothetical protein